MHIKTDIYCINYACITSTSTIRVCHVKLCNKKKIIKKFTNICKCLQTQSSLLYIQNFSVVKLTSKSIRQLFKIRELSEEKKKKKHTKKQNEIKKRLEGKAQYKYRICCFVKRIYFAGLNVQGNIVSNVTLKCNVRPLRSCFS